jgi:hypothetical protein
MGYQAGYQAAGNYWSAIGREAGYQAEGSYWSAMGYRAGREAEGSYWSAIGYEAGWSATGDYFSAFGNSAGYAAIGTNWTAIGSWAGRSAVGDNKVYIDAYASDPGGDGTNDSIFIDGNDAGKIRLGRNAGQVFLRGTNTIVEADAVAGKQAMSWQVMTNYYGPVFGQLYYSSTGGLTNDFTNTYIALSNWTGSANLSAVTADLVNGTLTPEADGYYAVDYNISGDVGVNEEAEICVFTNASEAVNLEAQFSCTATATRSCLGGSGILYLTNGTPVSLRGLSLDAAATFKIHRGQLRLQRIGR